MRWVVLSTLAAGCTAEVTQQPDAAPPIDAAPDMMPVEPGCPTDGTLAICFSFDAATLGTTYANEGTLAVSASLANIERAGEEGSGVALMTATSTMQVPANPLIDGIVAVDMRIRLDADVPAGGRVGLLDVDGGDPGFSLFIYAGTTTSHRIRCNLGAVDLYADTSIALGTFTNISCTCTNGNVAVRRDGISLAELAGTPTCEPANAVSRPLQIGQNSRADQMLAPNEPMIGAIDRVRLWTAVPAQ